MIKKDLLYYIIHLADNELILGHRISEWCGHGPILEQDIAITNMALDHIGQSRSLYQFAASVYNALSDADKQDCFASPAFADKKIITEDDLAYLRDVWDYKNVLLVEQSNGDWAETIARSFFYDQYSVLLYTLLSKSADASLVAIAEKSLKEATYHRKWSSEWIIRLGDGTEESKIRMQNAVNELWNFTGELFSPSPYESNLVLHDVAPDMKAIQEEWYKNILSVLEEAIITLPENNWMQQGGKIGNHSEHLGYILAEMQYMQRAYPGMEW